MFFTFAFEGNEWSSDFDSDMRSSLISSEIDETLSDSAVDFVSFTEWDGLPSTGAEGVGFAFGDLGIGDIVGGPESCFLFGGGLGLDCLSEDLT